MKVNPEEDSDRLDKHINYNRSCNNATQKNKIFVTNKYTDDRISLNNPSFKKSFENNGESTDRSTRKTSKGVTKIIKMLRRKYKQSSSQKSNTDKSLKKILFNVVKDKIENNFSKENEVKSQKKDLTPILKPPDNNKLNRQDILKESFLLDICNRDIIISKQALTNLTNKPKKKKIPVLPQNEEIVNSYIKYQEYYENEARYKILEFPKPSYFNIDKNIRPDFSNLETLSIEAVQFNQNLNDIEHPNSNEYLSINLTNHTFPTINTETTYSGLSNTCEECNYNNMLKALTLMNQNEIVSSSIHSNLCKKHSRKLFSVTKKNKLNALKSSICNFLF